MAVSSTAALSGAVSEGSAQHVNGSVANVRWGGHPTWVTPYNSGGAPSSILRNSGPTTVQQTITHTSGHPTPVQMQPHGIMSTLHPADTSDGTSTFRSAMRPKSLQDATLNNVASANQNSGTSSIKEGFQVDESWLPVPMKLLPVTKKGVTSGFARGLYSNNARIAAHLCGAGNVSQDSPEEADVDLFLKKLVSVFDFVSKEVSKKLAEKCQQLCRKYNIYNSDGQPPKTIDDIQKVCFNGSLSDDDYLVRVCHFSRVLFEYDYSWINEAELAVMSKYGIKFDFSTPKSEKKSFVCSIAMKEHRDRTYQRYRNAMSKNTGACFYIRNPSPNERKHLFGDAETEESKRRIICGSYSMYGTLVTKKVAVPNHQEFSDRIQLAVDTSTTEAELVEKVKTIWRSTQEVSGSVIDS